MREDKYLLDVESPTAVDGACLSFDALHSPSADLEFSSLSVVFILVKFKVTNREN